MGEEDSCNSLCLKGELKAVGRLFELDAPDSSAKKLRPALAFVEELFSSVVNGVPKGLGTERIPNLDEVAWDVLLVSSDPKALCGGFTAEVLLGFPEVRAALVDADVECGTPAAMG